MQSTQEKIELHKLTDKANIRIFSILSKGDIFGVPELFESKQVISAKTQSDCLLAAISRKDFF